MPSAILYLLNQFDASVPLHLDVRAMLQQQLGDRLIPFVLRRSSVVSEALAEGMTVIDYAPGSGAAEDYRALAGWLHTFIPPAVAGHAGVRWSERVGYYEGYTQRVDCGAHADVLACAHGECLAPTEIERGFQRMYNLEFEQAHQDFSPGKGCIRRIPSDRFRKPPATCSGSLPVSASSKVSSSPATRTLKLAPSLLRIPRCVSSSIAPSKGDQLADAALKQHPEDSNALFAKVLALGLRSDYVAMIDKQDFAALRYMKQGRILAQQLLKQKPDAYDALLAVGVENYLTGIKPAPVRWMLSLGGIDPDKQQGIRELQETAAHGNLLKPFAKLLLAVAALRDKNNTQGCDLLRELATAYPRNALYRDSAPECHGAASH